MSLIGVCLMAAAAFAFVAALVVLATFVVSRKLTRWHGHPWGAVIVVIGFTGLVGMQLFLHGDVFERFTRKSDLARADENARPLVDAIRNFQRAHARPPKQLSELVPDYLPSIPATGLSSWPKYEYVEGEGSTDGEWGLIVSIPRYFFDLDGNRRFEYAPTTPGSAPSSSTLRRGDWIYVPK